MRLAALALALVGMALLAAGLVVGLGAFSWNGRHAFASYPLTPGAPFQTTFDAKRERRYTAAVDVVFVREGLAERDGELVVAAKLPLVARLLDDQGTAVSEAIGWLEPGVPPTALYGQGAHERPVPELLAERLLGAWTCPRDERVSVVVDLGTDRLGEARVEAARLVLYDDAWPTSIKVAWGAAAAGLVIVIAAFGLLVFGGRKRRPARPA